VPLPKVPSAPAYPRERRVPHLVMPPPRRRYRPSAHHRDQKHGMPTPCLQEVMEWTWECVCVYCSTYYKAVRVWGGGTMEDMCYVGCVFITYYKAVRVGDYCFIQSAVIISRIFAPTNS